MLWGYAQHKNMMKYKYIKPLVFILLMPLCIYAHGADFSGGYAEGAAFSLDLERNVSDWSVGATVVESRISQYRVSYYEQLNQHLMAGMHLAYLQLTQRGNAITSGMELSGESFGLSFQQTVFTNANMRLLIQGEYGYQDVDDKSDLQNITIDWHEFQLALSAIYRFESLEFFAGGRYVAIDGDEVSSGGINQTLAIESDDDYGAFVGVNYWVDSTGSIGIHIERGARKIFNLEFMRHY
jgi:hypothetical protein